MSLIRAKQIKSNNVGDLLHGNGTGFGLLSIGTSGQVLTVVGGDTVWMSPTVPDAFVYRGTVDAGANLLPQVGTPVTGDYYSVYASSGTQNFNGTWDANSSAPFIGATFKPGDAIVFNGTTWDKFDNNDPTVIGTTDEITVSYDPLAEQYTVGMSPTYAGSTSITTLGTISTGNWQATLIARQFGGTGSDTSSIGANRILYATSTTTTGGIVAPTMAGTSLQWNGSAFVWVSLAANAYSFINGDSGTSTAVGSDTLAILGGLGLTTIAADGSPDSLTINTDIATGSVLVNNVGTGSAQLGIRGATSGTILQAKGSSTEAAFTSYTLPATVGTTGKFLVSDGTNFINSSFTFPSTLTAPGALVVNTNGVISNVNATTAGQVLQYNGSTVGFSALSYSNLTGTPTDSEDEFVVVTPAANLTVTGFFSHTPIMASISVFFNGLRLKNSGWSVSGMDLTLVDSVNGYTTDVGDELAAIYQY
jgi:hypothetical protein